MMNMIQHIKYGINWSSFYKSYLTSKMLNKDKMFSQSIHYTLITPTVAIGDIYSPYNEFDVIVNLSNNSKADIGEIYIEDVNRVGTINPIQIIHIGLIDRPDQAECCKKLIGEIIPSLLQQCDKRILFHCNTGKSRSATFAVAFLSRLFSKNAMDVLEDVIRKRPIVKPNVGFMYVLQKMSN